MTRKCFLLTLAMLTALSMVVAPCTFVQASSIQFDFSDSQGVYNGYDSPGFAAGDFTSSETTWSQLSLDSSSGFLYSDGAAASGIAVDFGRGGGTMIDWNIEPATTASGGATSGVYDTALMRDWLETSGDNSLGARVSGLPAGDYRVYALVCEFPYPDDPYDVSIGVNIDTNVASPLPVGDATGVTTWVDGLNYAVADVTVSSDTDWITVIVDPTKFGYTALPGIQIVPVPEPGSLGLLMLAAMGLIPFARRRK